MYIHILFVRPYLIVIGPIFIENPKLAKFCHKLLPSVSLNGNIFLQKNKIKLPAPHSPFNIF